jgi:hypothetical protein
MTRFSAYCTIYPTIVSAIEHNLNGVGPRDGVFKGAGRQDKAIFLPNVTGIQEDYQYAMASLQGSRETKVWVRRFSSTFSTKAVILGRFAFKSSKYGRIKA